tara:strand:+ start:683332 stop:684000 length:669 start_codon:yes stop_codon:yes gene_type:complete
MPRHEIPGFTPRSVAQKTYSRSKSSFIRDVDDAFEREDAEFLSHFRVMLNDGTVIEGIEATKEKVLAVQSKQPRWHVATAFLDTRYWDGGSAAQSDKHRVQEQAIDKTTNYEELIGMKHELSLATQRIDTQSETINRLEGDKTFLQTELENRRGEIEKLQGFFASVGEAADSAAKLAAGREEQVDTVAATVSRNAATDARGTVMERYLPTFQQFISKIRPSK